MSRFDKKLKDTGIDIEELLNNDNIEDKILTPEEERRKKIEHIVAIVATVLVVAVMTIAVISSLDGKDSSKKKDNKTTQTKITETKEEINELTEDKYPEIAELVTLYYNAKLSGDTEAIEKYVDNIEDVNMQEIKSKNKYIKKYSDIECYTKSGLYDNTYIVYACYNIKFKNINTLAPAIDVLYVIRDEETGSVYIHNGANSNNDIKNYTEALAQDEDVKRLYSDVNARLDKALKEDRNLKNLNEGLKKGAGKEQKKNKKSK